MVLTPEPQWYGAGEIGEVVPALRPQGLANLLTWLNQKPRSGVVYQSASIADLSVETRGARSSYIKLFLHVRNAHTFGDDCDLTPIGKELCYLFVEIRAIYLLVSHTSPQQSGSNECHSSRSVGSA